MIWRGYVICSIYCEIIINRVVLIFADFVVHLNHEINFFLSTVACNISNHDFKNPRITAFCKNHKNWYQRIKILSQ